jgi:fucose permease
VKSDASSRSGRSLSLIALLAFFSLGLPDGVLGVAWPSMRGSFALPMSQLGVLLTAAMVGYLASSFASGALVARLGLGRVLAASSAATAASALAYALASVWEVVVLSAVVAGLGAGAIDAGINAFAAARLSARVTTWLHASYGIGATLGPLLTGAVLGATGSWRMAYGLIGVVLATMTIGFVRTQDRWAVEEGPTPLARMGPGIGEALRQPRVWLSVGLFFVYAGLEVGIGQWAYSWLVEGRGVAPGHAAVWLAAYWGSLTAGRVVLGALTNRFSVETLLCGSLAGVFPGIFVLWAGLGPAAGAFGLPLLGLALAPIFPLLIATTPERVGTTHATHAVGFQVAAFYLGTAALPGAAGVLARHLGLDVLGPFLFGTALGFGGLYGLGLGWRGAGGVGSTRPRRSGADRSGRRAGTSAPGARI